MVIVIVMVSYYVWITLDFCQHSGMCLGGTLLSFDRIQQFSWCELVLGLNFVS